MNWLSWLGAQSIRVFFVVICSSSDDINAIVRFHNYSIGGVHA